ncbi:MAG: hypothetical protein HKN87_15125 [Saprospiraceae bacterium]|nr:hypothetical protein [Saprospiraceae bacterium]
MSTTQKALQQALKQQQKAQQIKRHLQQLSEQLEEAYRDLDTVRGQLEKEFKDIEKLEKISLKGLFHRALGSKEDQIEKERQEYLQVSLKYDEAKKSVELLEYEEQILGNKIVDEDLLRKNVEVLFKSREKELIKGKSKQGREILAILQQMDEYAVQVRNLKHVKKNGQQALSMLEKMLAHLDKARDWGQWDMTGRRGDAAYYKHSSIDKAKELSYRVKHLLVRFKEDLRVIYGPNAIDFSIHFASFNRFTDVFFDNLISDWIIQQKIQHALSNVASVRDRVLRILQSLDADIEKSKMSISDLKKSRRQIIITA